MFKCQLCNKTTAAGETQNKLVVETRVKRYRAKGRESKGTEIVKELNICNACKQRQKGAQ